MRWLAAALVLGGLGLAALDPGALLRLSGVRAIHSLDAEEAARLVESSRAVLLELPARAEGREGPLASGADAASAMVVVLADTPEAERREAARLARAGIQEVAVVRGGRAAWDAACGFGESRRYTKFLPRAGGPQGD